MPLPRPRVSLLTLLLLMTIVAMGLALIKLVPLRNEVVRLRNETGRLLVSDQTKLHAIQIKTYTDLTWRWRLFVPTGKTYWLKDQLNKVPLRDFPEITGGWPLQPGLQVLTIALRRNDAKQCWDMTTEFVDQDGSASSSITPVYVDSQTWPDGKHFGTATSGVGATSRMQDEQERLLLLRKRVQLTQGRAPPLAQGLLSWIEPEP